MDEYDLASGDTRDDLGWMTPISMFAIAMLSLVTFMIGLTRLARIGPDTGTAIVFDPSKAPRYWQEPELPARQVEGPAERACGLNPAIMIAGGGSMVVEAKEMSLPPLYRVHWSGARTTSGEKDCGRSADLVIPLSDLRALARVAGGFGVDNGAAPFLIGFTR